MLQSPTPAAGRCWSWSGTASVGRARSLAGNQRLYRSDDVRLDELRAALDAFWGHRVYAAVRPLHDDSWAKFLPQLATAAEGSRP
jgi:hypothetical protein